MPLTVLPLLVPRNFNTVLLCSLSCKFSTFTYKFVINPSAAWLYVSWFIDIWSFYQALYLVLISNFY